MHLKKIFVAGHNGMVGSALIKALEKDPKNKLITSSRSELDLTNQALVNEFFKNNDINEVYLAAAMVGGIYANNEYPADFIYNNLMIETNVINAAHQNGIQKLLFLGSSCIYPKLAKQPIAEKSLLSGWLEPTNEPYAIAKIAGIKLCESYNRQFGRDYRSIMPTNLYGPGDNFHPKNSHVIPALIRRIYEAKIANENIIQAWGTGTVLREFLYVDDMAEASIFLMNLDINKYKKETQPMLSHINAGMGKDISIRELVDTITTVIGFTGKIMWDKSKPDGSPRKLMDSASINRLGWKAKTPLDQGLMKTYDWFVKNHLSTRN